MAISSTVNLIVTAMQYRVKSIDADQSFPRTSLSQYLSNAVGGACQCCTKLETLRNTAKAPALVVPVCNILPYMRDTVGCVNDDINDY
eukprot:COSAG02_NODE_35_length_49339_cov_20.375102_23_plen_88_part_00